MRTLSAAAAPRANRARLRPGGAAQALGVTDGDSDGVYRTLRSMERDALVQSDWTPGRPGGRIASAAPGYAG